VVQRGSVVQPATHVPRHQPHGTRELLFRGRMLSKSAENSAKIVSGRSIPWSKRNRLLKKGESCLALALLVHQDPEELQRVGVLWIGRQDGLIGRFGLFQMTGLMVGSRGLQEMG